MIVSPTKAILFRTAAQHTQIIDEIDSHLALDALRSVLNAGYRKGACVERCDKVDGSFTPRKYPVYGARALAGIGRMLHETTMQRTFEIAMERQQRNGSERFSPHILKDELDSLRDMLMSFVNGSRGPVAEQFRKRDFPYLREFADRTQDVTEPLAAIVETAYANHPRLDEPLAALVIATGRTRGEAEYIEGDRQLLRQLRELTAGMNPVIGTATELANACGLTDENRMARMSATLRRYGYTTMSIRIGSTPKYRYTVGRSSLERVLDLYFGEEPPPIPDAFVVGVVTN